MSTPRMHSLRSLLACKPVQFATVGLLLHLALSAGIGKGAPVQSLVFSPERVGALRQGWIASMGRPPDEQETAALLRHEIDTEILFREAVALSLHRFDPTVRQRLLLNMRFLDPATRTADQALFERALALGMHESDVVVRRRLVQVMERSIQDGIDRSAASDEEIRAARERQPTAFMRPARWRITQVCFSAGRRNRTALADASDALAELRRHPPEAADGTALGDPVAGGSQLPLLSERQLAGQFGQDFAAAIAGCAVGEWCGPLASGYGQHLVRVEEAQAASLPAADDPELRRRLESEALRVRAARRLEAAMRRLRREYGVSP